MAEYFEKIEKYLDNELSEEEVKLFEQKLSESKGFNTELGFHIQARKYLKDLIAEDNEKGYYQLRKLLSLLGDDILIHPPKPRKKTLSIFSQNPWTARVAAVVAILLAIALLYPSQQVILEDYLTSNEIELNSSKGGVASSSDSKEAQKLYYQGNYTDAYKIWEALANSNDNPQIRLNAGICLLHLGDEKKALFWFEKNLQAEILLDETYWYTSLAYISLKDNEKAIEYLCKGSVYKTSRPKERKELLNKLDAPPCKN